MPDKNNVYLCQFSHLYGDNIYLPYSAGTVWAYSRSLPDIADRYELKDFIFVREDPDKIVDSMDDPAVVGFSTYVWNWEMSCAVAARVKERYPDCLVVFGGPQVPDPDRFQFYDYPAKYPFIDVSVHGEGEIALSEILTAHLHGRDFGEIPGITWRGGTTETRQRTTDLNIFPSPYLTGVFEDLFDRPYTYNVIFETNRGCPYGCTFCDWGSLTAQKLFNFDIDRIYAEIEYFGVKKLPFLFAGDANFGILERDMDIAKHLAATKRKYGYPQKMRVNYAKNSTRRVYELAKILNEEDLDKGITLSVQSMDKNTLKVIKRRNLKFDTYKGFMSMYEEAGIEGYSEVVTGLPDETYETYKAGIDELFDACAHDSLAIYRCQVLPNAPMNEPSYRALHKIETVRVPIYLNHTYPGSDPVQEYEESVAQTATLSREQIIQCNALAWIVQGFHGLNLTQVLACYARVEHGLRFTDFYEALMEWGGEHPETVCGAEYIRSRQHIVDVDENGGNLDNVLPEFLGQTWANEEASFLICSKEYDRFYDELELFLDWLEEKNVLVIDPDLRADLLAYQKALVVKWDGDGSTQTLRLGHSVHSFHRAVITDAGEPELRKGQFELTVADPDAFDGDKAAYATQIVWWGRRGGGGRLYERIAEVEVGGPAVAGPAAESAARATPGS